MEMLIRVAIIMSSLFVTLWLTSSEFDSTEGWTMVSMFLVVCGAEGLVHVGFRGRK